MISSRIFPYVCSDFKFKWIDEYENMEIDEFTDDGVCMDFYINLLWR